MKRTQETECNFDAVYRSVFSNIISAQRLVM